MLSYRRETALQGALYFWPKVEDLNRETIFYGHYRFIFNHCKSSVYCAFLDATKAFDRVNYCKLL